MDTNGKGGNTMWYKRSTYRLFHNIVHSFKQPKLSRTLLAKWRALSADKKSNCNDLNASTIPSSSNVWNKFSSDEDDDNLDDEVAIVEMIRNKFGAAPLSLSRSEQLEFNSNVFLDERTRYIDEVTGTLLLDSNGHEQKVSVDAVTASREPYTEMSASECVLIESKLKKGRVLDEVLDDGDDDYLEDNYNLNGASEIHDVPEIHKVVIGEIGPESKKSNLKVHN